MDQNSRIYVAGHRGLVGSALVRALTSRGYRDLLLRPHRELDLTDQVAVNRFFRDERPEYVLFAAAKVGGIHANATQQADFLYQNLMMAANVIHAAAESDVKKLLFLGSSCIYPKFAPQPISEDSLLTGSLEPTNEGYAIAKIAGLKLCEKYREQYGRRFISAMPTNLYGPFDNFHPTGSHVIPGMMRRFHEAKLAGASAVTVWGTGTPRREFLHVDDLASACLILMESYDDRAPVNVGTGEDLPIAELAEFMASVVGFTGAIDFDVNKPDGTPRKVLDVSRMRALGWRPSLSLEEGLRSTYAWAVENQVFA